MPAATANASAAEVRYPEYDKLFQCGRLETTIAIGFDEYKNHVFARREVLDGLRDRGFTQIRVKDAGPYKALSDAKLTKFGIDLSRVDRDASYFVKSFKTNEGKVVQSVVRLIDSDHPNAKQSFAEAMSNDELVLYGGHARHGSGPDFDQISSPLQNYVIGKAYDNVVTYGDNDLKKARLPNKYQLMLFSACTTRHYLDDLRRLPKNKNASNLDLLVSTKELGWGRTALNIFTVLDGVMAGESINQMEEELEKNNPDLDAKTGKPKSAERAFIADGFRGNKYRPWKPG